MRKTTYTTLVDANGREVVKQVVEDVILYSKLPVLGSAKGNLLDIKV